MSYRMDCPNCEQQISMGSNYCLYCGEEQGED